MKSVAAEERRIQQQIVAQQKKELTSFLENQKKEYRLCKDKIKEVNILKFIIRYEIHILPCCLQIILTPSTLFCLFVCFIFLRVLQEMSEDPCTPKEEKQERLSRHKETMQRSQAEEEAHLLAQQRLVYDRSCRALKRRSVVRRHEFEQEQLREVMQFLQITQHYVQPD